MNDREQQTLLATFRPWLRTVAAGLSRNDAARADDLAQEGWVAMWRLLQGKPDAPDSWLKKRATWRMLECIRQEQQVSHDVRRTFLFGLGSIELEETSGFVWTQLTYDLGNVELAYHHGEIAQALDRLTPKQREYVILKFWCGYGNAELTEHFGYHSTGFWHHGAKPALRGELIHLARD